MSGKAVVCHLYFKGGNTLSVTVSAEAAEKIRDMVLLSSNTVIELRSSDFDDFIVVDASELAAVSVKEMDMLEHGKVECFELARWRDKDDLSS